MSTTISAVIFDLDGTLIDSSESILDAYRAAFLSAGREPVIPLDSSIIGPPLQQTLQQLAGEEDDEVVTNLAQAFMQHYDNVGYLKTQVFDGVDALLRDAQSAGYRLFIATNKRIRPTRLILEHLRWTDLFQEAYALDAFEPRLPSKAELIDRILMLHQLQAADCLYVGDRDEDRLAAQACDVPFFCARWGYGLSSTEAGNPAHPSAEGISWLRRLLEV